MPKPIVLFPNDVLQQRCTEVAQEEFGSDAFMLQCADLRETVEQTKNAAGLAANQIGIPKRFFIIKGFSVIVNPEIIAYKGERVPMMEGCLSIPSISAYVVRNSKIDVKFFDPDGAQQEGTLKGWVARVYQHEYDHLNGDVFLSKMDIAAKEQHKAQLAEWGVK